MDLTPKIDSTNSINAELDGRSDEELLVSWADIMSELSRRGLIRTANNPVADYAEHLVAKLLGLSLEGNSKASYDAVGSDGIRY